MKSYFYTLIFSFFYTFISAQNLQISKEQLLRTDSYYEIIGKIGEKILLFKSETTQFSVQVYNEKLHLEKEEVLKLGKSYLKLVGITATAEDFTVIFSHRHKGDTHLKAHKYNGAVQIVDSVTIEVFERRAFSPFFIMEKAQNKTTALLYNINKEKELETIAFDTKKLNKLWSYTFLPKDYYHRTNFVQFLIDNEGGAHLVMTFDNERSKKETNRLEFITFNPKTLTTATYLLPLMGNLWHDANFSFDNLNKKIVGAGLFANEFQTQANGFFYVNINPENPEEHVLNFAPFDFYLVQSVLGKEKLTKKEGIADIDTREIILRNDGGLLLVTERNREYVRQTATTTSATYSARPFEGVQKDFYYDDLVVFSIHPTGELHWSEILHKKQYSQDDDALHSSYFLIKNKNLLRFLYNDEIKQESTVNEYVLTGKGKVKRSNLLNTEGIKLMLVFTKSAQVSADEVIIPSERRKQLRLVRLKYE